MPRIRRKGHRERPRELRFGTPLWWHARLMPHDPRIANWAKDVVEADLLKRGYIKALEAYRAERARCRESDAEETSSGNASSQSQK